MIAAGTASMTVLGNKVVLNPVVFAADEQCGFAFGMGLSAEKVARQWQTGREAQDIFVVESHRKAFAAIAARHFKVEISPFAFSEHLPDLKTGEVRLCECPPWARGSGGRGW